MRDTFRILNRLDRIHIDAGVLEFIACCYRSPTLAAVPLFSLSAPSPSVPFAGKIHHRQAVSVQLLTPTASPRPCISLDHGCSPSLRWSRSRRRFSARKLHRANTPLSRVPPRPPCPSPELPVRPPPRPCFRRPPCVRQQASRSRLRWGTWEGRQRGQFGVCSPLSL